MDSLLFCLDIRLDFIIKLLIIESMKQVLFDLVKSVIDSLGLDIYHIEFHKNVLRVLIEANENRVTVETCADVSRLLSAKLDAADLIPHRYRLEVSSPGIERTLFKPAHYKRFIGYNCRLITKQGLFLGKILEADDEKVRIESTSKVNSQPSEIVTIPYIDIKTGQLKVPHENLFGRNKKNEFLAKPSQ